MILTNPSLENLRADSTVRPSIYGTSQVNPNSSSTNLSKLIGQRHNQNNFHAPVPSKRISLSNNQHFSSFQLPLTPPVSKASTPVKEHRFNLDSSAESTLFGQSLDSWRISKYVAKYMPPIDIKVTSLCITWYVLSIVSNNSTKMILSQFQHPITLTQFQFLINSILSVCLLALVSLKSDLRSYFPKGVLPIAPPAISPVSAITSFLVPTNLIISTTLPMGCFQFIGHLTSHKATSLIPVSLVHTIKALSPLMTVLIYRSLFKIKYKVITYVTLVPLIIGIMLTCYKPKKPIVNNSNSNSPPPTSSYLVGLSYAFVSMMIFVSQNIFAKKRLTIEKDDKVQILPTSKEVDDQNTHKKVDKLTILFYCSVIGFIFTLPIYIVAEFTAPSVSLLQLTSSTVFLVILNGFSHFLQSLLAFQILGAMSPINYSIANILKRIIIIIIAFMWENKNFSNVQASGLCLTVLGLYCYDRWGTSHGH